VTMAFSLVVSGGLTSVADSWATYALMLGGPCSLLLTQTAYQAGRSMITLPVIAVVTPVASLAAGNLLLGESARLGVLSSAAAALAVLATSAGLVILARLTTVQPASVHPGRRRPDCLDAPGRAPRGRRVALSRGSVAASKKRQDCRPQQGHAFVVGQAVGRTEVDSASTSVQDALCQDRHMLRCAGEREPVEHVVRDQPASGIVVADRDEPLDLQGQARRERISRIELGDYGQVLCHLGARPPSRRFAIPRHYGYSAQHDPDLRGGPSCRLTAREDAVAD
jgi:hypothetical protein